MQSMLANHSNRHTLRSLALLLFLVMALLFRPSMAETLEEMAYSRHFPELLDEIERRLPGATEQQRVRLLTLKAECFVNMGSDEGASALEAIEPRTASPRFFRVRGQWQIEQEQFDLARKDFRHALRVKPDEREVLKIHIQWADMESRIGNNEEALGQLSKALEILSAAQLPDSAWNSFYDTRYFVLQRAGEEREARNSLLLARAHLTSINNQEGVAWTYSTEALDHRSAGRRLESRKAWETALNAAPKTKASIFLHWGFTHVFGESEPDEVRYYVDLLEREWPDNLTPFEHFHLRLLQGQIWSKLADHTRALNYYRLAEEQAVPSRRFSGRHLIISLSFHRFSPPKGSSDMELALWTQLQAMDERGLGIAEIADFMDEKLQKLPSGEQAAWLFELGRRLLNSEPQRSADLFQKALHKAEAKFRKDFLDAVALEYLKRGRTNLARPFLHDLSEEMTRLDDAANYQLLRRMSREYVSQMPYQNLWFSSSRVLLAPAVSLVDEELRSTSQSLEAILARDLAKFEKGFLPTRRAELYKSKGDFFFVQGRLTEAGAAYEMGLSLVDKDSRLASSLHRNLALVYQQRKLLGVALQKIQEAGSLDNLESRLHSNAVEVSLHLEMGQADEALRLCEESLTEAKDEGRRAFQFARACALLELGRLEAAKAGLQKVELQKQKTEFQVAYYLKLARIYLGLQQAPSALDSLKEAWGVATELNSDQMREVALVWMELRPKTVPRELANLIDAHTEVGARNPILSSAEFLRVTDSWMTQHPEMATGVALLPRAMVARAKTLAEDEALVQFYVGEQDLLCMVGTLDGLFTQHLQIEKTIVKQWIQNLEKESQAARKLGSVLLDPIDSVCQGRTLILLTTGELSSLAWDRLELSGGALVEEFPWMLWAGEISAQSTLAKNPKLLALGGITDAKLAASRREVLALGASVENVLAILTGEEANRANLRHYLPQADILHLATHSAPEYLRLSDGVLPRKEIYDLPLKPGALVVLSSCEGAKPGAQERAPVTLASSLLAAGASQVIASLERVSDEETELFFLQFYEELARDLSPVKALRRTKLKQRSDSRKDWHKFVILGG